VNDLMQYFARIGAAILLIKYASTLVKDAEKLLTANVKARLPEVADELDGPPYGQMTDIEKVDESTEWVDPLDGQNGVGMTQHDTEAEIHASDN